MHPQITEALFKDLWGQPDTKTAANFAPSLRRAFCFRLSFCTRFLWKMYQSRDKNVPRRFFNVPHFSQKVHPGLRELAAPIDP